MSLPFLSPLFSSFFFDRLAIIIAATVIEPAFLYLPTLAGQHLFFVFAMAFTAASYVIDARYTVTRRDFQARERTNYFVRKYGARGFLASIPIIAAVGLGAYFGVHALTLQRPFGLPAEYEYFVSGGMILTVGLMLFGAFLHNFVNERKEKK